MKTYLCLFGLMLIMTAGLYGADNVLTPQEKAEGWMLLFDGKTLNGWDSAIPEAAKAGRGPSSPAKPGDAPAQGSKPRPCSTRMGRAPVAADASHWEVIDGVISPCGETAGYLTSKQDFKDLVLKVDFKTGEDTNGGVFVRAPGGNMGYEVQIWKAQPAGFNTGAIVGVAKTDREYRHIPDKWNTFEITADGDHLVVVLNGTKTFDAHDSKFADGRIVLQYQKFPTEFKNIKVRPIKH